MDYTTRVPFGSMLGSLTTNPILFALAAVALLVAITIHEFAHAFIADKLGDPTPRLQGRVTLNPLAHLDPIGTVLLLLIRFGWGKPVEFDPYNLKDPKRDTLLISLAGPASNLILASLLSIVLYFVPSIPEILIGALIITIQYNIVLAVFNLIPIHPLDGGKILVGLLPHKDSIRVDAFLRQYGMFLLIFLLLPVWGGQSPMITLISPPVNFFLNVLIPGSFFL